MQRFSPQRREFRVGQPFSGANRLLGERQAIASEIGFAQRGRDIGGVVVLAMTGFGFFKGLYDANIWASLYDVVPLERRATALGVMNAVGWFGGGLAPVIIAALSTRYGMSASISAVSVIYLGVGLLLVIGIRMFMPASFNAPASLRPR